MFKTFALGVHIVCIASSPLIMVLLLVGFGLVLPLSFEVGLVAVAHAFNPSTWEVEACEFEASFVYIVSFKTTRAT